MSHYLFTSESVTEGHPDKICDQISDAVLDAILAADPEGRVACAEVGNTRKIIKTKSAETVRTSAAYDRLANMGQRLLEVIRHNRGGANKDLAKFASQIAALCDKWDR